LPHFLAVLSKQYFLHIVTLEAIIPEVDSEGISFVLPFTTVMWVESL